jgi:hypothetical protein
VKDLFLGMDVDEPQHDPTNNNNEHHHQFTNKAANVKQDERSQADKQITTFNVQFVRWAACVPCEVSNAIVRWSVQVCSCRLSFSFGGCGCSLSYALGCVCVLCRWLVGLRLASSV